MKIQTTHDREADAVYIRLADGPVDRTIDVGLLLAELPILVDLDAAGRILGFEIISASSVLKIEG